MRNIDLIKSKFGDDYLETSSNEVRFKCPYCRKKRGKADTDYKLYINLDSLLFHCFKCGTSGNLSSSLSNNLSSICTTSVYKSILEFFPSEKSTNSFLETDDTPLFFTSTTSVFDSTVAHDYLKIRHISDDLIEYYNLKLGTGRCFGRIIIPNKLFNDVFTDMYSARTFIAQSPKYLNPPGALKNECVFNLHRISKDEDFIIITEGVLTAMSAGKTAVAVYGSSPSDVQIQKILEKTPKTIYCCLDGDAFEKNLKLSHSIFTTGYCGKIFITMMPIGIDANDFCSIDSFLDFMHDNSILYDGDYNLFLALLQTHYKNF